MEFRFEIMKDGGARLLKADGEDKVVSVPDVWGKTHPGHCYWRICFL